MARKLRHRFGKDTKIKILDSTFEFRMSGRGTLDWQKRLDDIDKKLKDFTPVFEEFGQYMLKSIDRTHQSEGRPNRWVPLTPATLKDKERKGYGSKKILERTGRLIRSYRYEAKPKSFSLKNLAPYHKYHQYGTKHMPARITIQLLLQDKQQFTRIKNKHLGL